MRKYVLNIDKMYSGSTANALVLSQVDSEFPTLIDNPPFDQALVAEWIRKWQNTYPDFNPPFDLELKDLGKYVLNFNLELQKRFKDSGHAELYMMDDTSVTREVHLSSYVQVNHAIGDKIEVKFSTDVPSQLQLKRISEEYASPQSEKSRLDGFVKELREFVKGNNASLSGFNYQDLKEYDDWTQPLPEVGGINALNNIINKVNAYVDGLNDYITTYNSQNLGSKGVSKQNMHDLNGLFVNERNKQMSFASQMNVLFPHKKMSVKSLYASQLQVESNLDDKIELSPGITLRGHVSYLDCIRGIANVGGDLYTLSPMVPVVGEYDFKDLSQALHSNDFPVDTGNGMEFSHRITLFQPSQGNYLMSTSLKFIEWYETHNHKTVVT